MKTENRIVVKSLSTLKRLQSQGHITLHSHTGKKVSSPFGDCFAWYIDDAVHRRFESGLYKYSVEYVSGCFNPFVFMIGRTDGYPLTENDAR